MNLTHVNAPDAPQPSGGYSQTVSVADASRLLFISGQIPETATGDVPQDFSDQCRLVWRNIEAQLRAAGMGIENLVKVATFLARSEDREENSRIRQSVLAGHSPALTVVLCQIYSPEWLLEIEAIAAA